MCAYAFYVWHTHEFPPCEMTERTSQAAMPRLDAPHGRLHTTVSNLYVLFPYSQAAMPRLGAPQKRL
jgi:hypothetical protein